MNNIWVAPSFTVAYHSIVYSYVPETVDCGEGPFTIARLVARRGRQGTFPDRPWHVVPPRCEHGVMIINPKYHGAWCSGCGDWRHAVPAVKWNPKSLMQPTVKSISVSKPKPRYAGEKSDALVIGGKTTRERWFTEKSKPTGKRVEIDPLQPMEESDDAVKREVERWKKGEPEPETPEFAFGLKPNLTTGIGLNHAAPLECETEKTASATVSSDMVRTAQGWAFRMKREESRWDPSDILLQPASNWVKGFTLFEIARCLYHASKADDNMNDAALAKAIRAEWADRDWQYPEPRFPFGWFHSQELDPEIPSEVTRRLQRISAKQVRTTRETLGDPAKLREWFPTVGNVISNMLEIAQTLGVSEIDDVWGRLGFRS